MPLPCESHLHSCIFYFYLGLDFHRSVTITYMHQYLQDMGHDTSKLLLYCTQVHANTHSIAVTEVGAAATSMHMHT